MHRTTRLRTVHGTAAILVLTATLSGCDSAIPGGAIAGEIDVRKLDVGTYPTEPLDLRYTYNPTLSTGQSLATMRLADRVVTGQEIDPRFTWGKGAIPVSGDTSASQLVQGANGPVLKEIAKPDGMMYGVAVSTSDMKPGEYGRLPPNAATATVVVMQFPNDTAADRAAGEIEAADLAAAPGQNHLDLPDDPRAHAHWNPNDSIAVSTLARGSYVVTLILGNIRDSGGPAAVLHKTYAAQIPLLDALRPLSTEEILRLPYDSDGLLDRTLNTDAWGDPSFENQATMALRGFLHRVDDQDRYRKILTEAGMDRAALTQDASYHTSMVIRTRDEQAARALTARIVQAQDSVPADPPIGPPYSACAENKNADFTHKRFRCAVGYRRYVATVDGDQLRDTQQRADAQYALLANSL